MAIKNEDSERRSNRHIRNASSGFGVSSDLRRMLAVLASGIEALESAQDRSGTDLRAGMKRAVTNAVRLTNELNRLEREMLGPMESIAVQPFAKQFEYLSRSVIPDSATISIDVAPGTWPVRATRSGLDSALMALVKNSAEAIGSGGKIEIRITNNPASGSVRFEVSDNGEGISPDDLDLIFTPFFSTKRKPRRLGLGLTRVWRFANQSGGNIRLQSVQGRGCTVIMELPAALTEKPKSPPRITSRRG